MAKRFIDTNIFRKSFMKNIPVEAKLFYVYLFCECDHCGIWQVEFEVAKVRLGLVDLTLEEVYRYFADKVKVFDAGNKWFLPQFILFQYGELKPTNKIHNSVLNSLNKFNLLDLYLNYDDTKGFDNPLASVKDKDKDKDKEQDKDKETKILFQSNDCEPIQPKTQQVVRKLQKTAKNTEKSQEYTMFMADYSDFMKKRGMPVQITAADGKGLKSIIEYLNSVDSVKQGGKQAVEIWQHILLAWGRLSPWLQTQVQLRQINSQLPNIIEHLRQNGKQTNNPTSAQQLAEALRGAIQNGGSL
jgi:hypothetical protein